MIEMANQTTAAQVSATFYQAGAAAGSAGFEPVVAGPMGDWPSTPGPSPCNAADDPQTGRGPGTCDRIISSGVFTCAFDLCATCGEWAHACDLACGFVCVDGGVANSCESSSSSSFDPSCVTEHQSYASYDGCSNEDRWCLIGIPASFGIHPVRILLSLYF